MQKWHKPSRLPHLPQRTTRTHKGREPVGSQRAADRPARHHTHATGRRYTTVLEYQAKRPRGVRCTRRQPKFNCRVRRGLGIHPRQASPISPLQPLAKGGGGDGPCQPWKSQATRPETRPCTRRLGARARRNPPRPTPSYMVETHYPRGRVVRPRRVFRSRSILAPTSVLAVVKPHT